MRLAPTTSPHARYIAPAAVPRPHPQHQAPAHPRYDAQQALPFLVARPAFVDPAGGAATIFGGVITINAHHNWDVRHHRHAQRPIMRPFPIAYTAFFASRRSPSYHLHHYPRRPSAAQLPVRLPCGTSHRLSFASSVPASLECGVRHPPGLPAALAVAGDRLRHHRTARDIPGDYEPAARCARCTARLRHRPMHAIALPTP
ncbi:hypothetical protein C8J57DRAFT_306280 [Mycena rebaudengoi]|nr:hypothetical protein C8J57DRAFT_306280 [Mycena rebaudengoi]